VPGHYTPDKRSPKGYIRQDQVEQYLAPLRRRHASVRIVAVITGKLRQAWQASEARPQFEDRVRAVLGPLKVDGWGAGGSYFASQEQEGQLEGLATANLLQDVSHDYDPMINLGIGRGSSQWATAFHTTGHGWGMADPERLVGPVESLRSGSGGMVHDGS